MRWRERRTPPTSFEWDGQTARVNLRVHARFSSCIHVRGPDPWRLRPKSVASAKTARPRRTSETRAVLYCTGSRRSMLFRHFPPPPCSDFCGSQPNVSGYWDLARLCSMRRRARLRGRSAAPLPSNVLLDPVLRRDEDAAAVHRDEHDAMVPRARYTCLEVLHELQPLAVRDVPAIYNERR